MVAAHRCRLAAAIGLMVSGAILAGSLWLPWYRGMFVQAPVFELVPGAPSVPPPLPQTLGSATAWQAFEVLDVALVAVALVAVVIGALIMWRGRASRTLLWVIAGLGSICLVVVIARIARPAGADPDVTAAGVGAALAAAALVGLAGAAVAAGVFDATGET